MEPIYDKVLKCQEDWVTTCAALTDHCKMLLEESPPEDELIEEIKAMRAKYLTAVSACSQPHEEAGMSEEINGLFCKMFDGNLDLMKPQSWEKEMVARETFQIVAETENKKHRKEESKPTEAATAEPPTAASACNQLNDEGALSEEMKPHSKKTLWKRVCHSLGRRKQKNLKNRMVQKESLQNVAEEMTTLYLSDGKLRGERNREIVVITAKHPTAASACIELQKAVASEEMKPNTNSPN